MTSLASMIPGHNKTGIVDKILNKNPMQQMLLGKYSHITAIRFLPQQNLTQSM
jgi:hypothetical protein